MKVVVSIPFYNHAIVSGNPKGERIDREKALYCELNTIVKCKKYFYLQYNDKDRWLRVRISDRLIELFKSKDFDGFYSYSHSW